MVFHHADPVVHAVVGEESPLRRAVGDRIFGRTASGCFYACNGRGGISIGQRPTCYGGWHKPGGVPDSGFVKDGSVIRMEYGGDGPGTIVIYVDGRRLGLMF